MRVTVLGSGTSQGVPVIACPCEICHSPDPKDKRLRSSVLLQVDGQTLVVDTGPDFRQQMLREQVKKLDAILFTHQHKDHTAGLDDVRAFNFIQQKPADIYAEQQVIDSLKSEFPYAFDNHGYPGIPQLNVNLIQNKPFFAGPSQIIPIRAYHHQLPVLGFRVHDFVYLTDVNDVAPAEQQKLQGTKYLILDALRKEEHISHFNLAEAIEFAQKQNVETTYLTHISHRMGFHALVEKELPSGVHLAYDGLQLEL